MINNGTIVHSLLIGNGINLIPEDHTSSSALAWKDLILSVFNDERYKDKRNGYVDLKSTSYPLQYERMVNYLFAQRAPDQQDNPDREAKKIIISELNKTGHPINQDIIKALRKIPCSFILTTNYDTNLETAIRGRKYNYSLTAKENITKENAIFLKRTSSLTAKGRPENEYQKIDFYHVHGINSVPDSLCLGYLHYSDIVRLLRQRLCGNAKNPSRPNIIKYLKDEECKYLSKEYQTRFFDSNMAIIGLGLSDQEIDLWWILSYRARLIFSGELSGINTIVYYDVHTEKTTPEGYNYELEYQRVQKQLFSNMYIEYRPYVVSGNDYKSKYLEALNSINNDFRSGNLFYKMEANNFTL